MISPVLACGGGGNEEQEAAVNLAPGGDSSKQAAQTAVWCEYTDSAQEHIVCVRLQAAGRASTSARPQYVSGRASNASD